MLAAGANRTTISVTQLSSALVPVQTIFFDPQKGTEDTKTARNLCFLSELLFKNRADD